MRNIIECARHSIITSDILAKVDEKLSSGLLFYKDSKYPTYKYWYPSLDSGLPIVVKSDDIHSATYAFHDMVHTCLYDPLPDVDRNTYMLGKMVGEAVALFYSDGVFTNLVRKHLDAGYPFEKRQYIQMYDSLSAHVDARTLMIATATFAIFGDTEILYDLCKTDNDRIGVSLFIEKYSLMFEADLYWNHQVYNQYFGRKFEIDPSLCYHNNKGLYMTSIEEVVDHNMDLLRELSYEDNGNGIELAKAFHNENGLVYNPVKVSYSKKLDEELLTLIRDGIPR